MAKNSKVASNRIAVADTVSASLRVHGPEVAVRLSEVLDPSGRTTPAQMEALLGQLGKVLDGAAAELAAADLAHVHELSDDEGPRERRDTATAQVRDKLLALRDLLTGAYGEAAARAYHVVESLPEQPQQLLQRGRSVEELLRKKPLKTPSRHASLKVRLPELADELSALLDPLEAALSAVRREEREAQATQERKNRASEDWQRAYLGVTHLAYGAYILADRRELADRIEPTSRKRSGIEGPGDPAPVPTDPAPTSPAPPA